MSAPAPTAPRGGTRPDTAAPLPAGLAGLVAAVLVTLVGGLLYTGAAAAPVLLDPGALVRWGLPVVKAVHDLALATTIGSLLLAAGVLPPTSPAWPRTVRIAAVAAVVWTLAAVAVLVLGYADVTGRPVGGAAFGSELGYFVTTIDYGRQLMLTAAFAAVAATAAVGVRRPGGAALALVLAVVAVVPLALTGHAAGAASHEVATTAWWLHVLGISAWLGGLVALTAVSRPLGNALPVAARRYSAIAGWAFALVVVSGAANAYVRLTGPEDLLHGYGLLVLAKSVATALLGVAGWMHRRSVLPRLDADPAARGLFWRLVSGELVLLGAATGLAIALSRSAPPVPDTPPADPTPAERLIGEPLPPPPTPVHWLTETSVDLLWLVVAGGLAVAYLLGVRKLRARGDAWPVHRTLLWLLGCAALVYVTSGAPAAYGRVLFSAHMVQHMALSMMVPAPLVFGAPVTLAMRALPRRTDGSYGPREWLLLLVESRWARFVSQPVVAAVLFAGSLIVFYYSPLFSLALRTHVGHELMMIHFLLVGYLFVNAVAGVDPGPTRLAYPLRLMLLFATMAFHAFFGVSLLSSDTLLVSDWFSSMGWGIDALADQQEGGAIAWGIGEFPTVLLALVVAIQWSRSDDREARRTDRAADRDDDAQLAAYNEMLARLDERAHDDPRGGRRDRQSS